VSDYSESGELMDFDITKASKKLSSLNLRYRIGAFDLEIFWFRVMSVKGKWDVVRHKHSTFEIHMVAKGSSIVKLDDREFIVKEGQFYVTKPHEYHEQLNNNGIEYMEYSINYSIHLSPSDDKEAQFLYGQLKKSKCKPYMDNKTVRELFEKSLSSAYYEKFGFYSQIKHYILLILIAIVQIMSEEEYENYNIPFKRKKDDYRFSQITQYIQDNINSQIRTKDIAKYVHLSDKQISRIIKVKTGLSTKQYINQLRMEKAKKLLKHAEYSVKQIAEMLGFSSEYYFNKFFKREEGFPPGKYRNNIL